MHYEIGDNSLREISPASSRVVSFKSPPAIKHLDFARSPRSAAVIAFRAASIVRDSCTADTAIQSAINNGIIFATVPALYHTHFCVSLQ